MMTIEVQGIWKKFKIPTTKRTSPLGKVYTLIGERRYEEFWALQGISFHIDEAVSVGLIGPNGSGKSTLLKIIARIMRPDKGFIRTTGTIVPVLELGIGFHGDLTVRENALIYGVLMGLQRSKVKNELDSVLEFAGISRFRDARLRNLSSGMQVRLAFSIAIQSRADTFLVDEALSVGDAEFQQKCLAKFRELKKENKSVVLVSHSMPLIKGFCEKVLYLNNGQSRMFGESEQVINLYVNDTKRGEIDAQR